MSNVTDAQTLAVYNAEGQALPASIGSPTGAAIVETVVTATPFQISATRASVLYINVTTSAAMTVQMGPTSAGNTITVAASQSPALGVTTIEVPAGWYVDLTGTVANFVATAVLR